MTSFASSTSKNGKWQTTPPARIIIRYDGIRCVIFVRPQETQIDTGNTRRTKLPTFQPWNSHASAHFKTTHSDTEERGEERRRRRRRSPTNPLYHHLSTSFFLLFLFFDLPHTNLVKLNSTERSLRENRRAGDRQTTDRMLWRHSDTSRTSHVPKRAHISESLRTNKSQTVPDGCQQRKQGKNT